jgi:hypothetical protein
MDDWLELFHDKVEDLIKSNDQSRQLILDCASSLYAEALRLEALAAKLTKE